MTQALEAPAATPTTASASTATAAAETGHSQGNFSHLKCKECGAEYEPKAMHEPVKEIRPSGGGRVTEILTRPLFSLLFPELTAIIQPLSGEYAVRREVLEKIAFPIGYGVETSHLLDVYQKWGINAFAQTDLDQRIHRNQPTRALGKMSFGILQTFLTRAENHGVISPKPEISTVLRQFQAIDKSYEQVKFDIIEDERPPMITIPAYRKKYGIKDESGTRIAKKKK